MTIMQALIAFLGVAAVVVVTPGLDVAMVLRASAVGGARGGVHAAAGITLGCLIWGATVSVGLGALLAASELAFGLVRWAGAAYLTWMGLKLIVRPRQTFEGLPAGLGSPNPGEWLRRGLLTNLLNPKIAVFFISFLPQFVPAGANVALFSFLLAAIYAAMGALWFAVLIAATLPLSSALRRPAVITLMDRVTGGVFVAFGARLALSR